jgi:hypothetical protein
MLHHINTEDFDFAIRNGIYKLIEKISEDSFKVKYFHASGREELNKIQTVKVFSN